MGKISDTSHQGAPYYMSQFGQDRFIDQHLFAGKRGGFFVDIGAYDGVTISNTHFLEKHRAWQGICVEPIPERFAELESNRQCHCIQGCIDEKAGTREFIHIHGGNRIDLMGYENIEGEQYPRLRGREHTEMLSGLAHAYHPQHRRLIDNELVALGGTKEHINVRCYTFDDMMQWWGQPTIDYLSLDTEGGELEILKTIDFSRIRIKVISVEVLYPEVPIQSFLENQGYGLVATLGYDHIYRKVQRIQTD